MPSNARRSELTHYPSSRYRVTNRILFHLCLLDPREVRVHLETRDKAERAEGFVHENIAGQARRGSEKPYGGTAPAVRHRSVTAHMFTGESAWP